MILERDVTRRRYSKVRLYNAGRILHIARLKSSQDDNRYSYNYLVIITVI